MRAGRCRRRAGSPRLASGWARSRWHGCSRRSPGRSWTWTRSGRSWGPIRDVQGLPSASVARVAVTRGQENGLRGGLPSPALPGSGPWGSPFSLSAVQPLSLPVATPVTRRLVRSSSLDHLADDGQAARRRGRAPRAESPGVHGPDVLAPANSVPSGHQRRKPAATVSGRSRIDRFLDSHGAWQDYGFYDDRWETRES